MSGASPTGSKTEQTTPPLRAQDLKVFSVLHPAHKRGASALTCFGVDRINLPALGQTDHGSCVKSVLTR